MTNMKNFILAIMLLIPVFCFAQDDVKAIWMPVTVDGNG
jgi:hypothetical protein